MSHLGASAVRPVMSDDDVMIFESTEAAIVRAVETALTRAKVPHQLRFERPTLNQLGPHKPPKRIFVKPAAEAEARAIVETAVVRRARVESLQPKPERSAPPGGDWGSIGLGGIDIVSDFGGGDGGGCE